MSRDLVTVIVRGQFGSGKTAVARVLEKALKATGAGVTVEYADHDEKPDPPGTNMSQILRKYGPRLDGKRVVIITDNVRPPGLVDTPVAPPAVG